MTKKVSRIQVPNDIIVDRGLSHDSFGLYVILKKHSYNNRVNIYPTPLKEDIRWKDNRKLKKSLKELYDYGLIDTDTKRIDVYRPIELNIKKFEDEEYFTQVDTTTLREIKNCTEKVDIKGQKTSVRDVYSMGLRLFYYYEKNYNAEYLRAFPSYELINEDTGISLSYIKALNDVFHENGIVEVFQGKYYNMKLEDGTPAVRKEVNSYIPLCNRVV